MSQSQKEGSRSERPRKFSSDADNRVPEKDAWSLQNGIDKLQEQHVEREEIIRANRDKFSQIEQNHEIEGNAISFVSKIAPLVEGTAAREYMKPYVNDAIASGSQLYRTLQDLGSIIGTVVTQSSDSTATMYTMATGPADYIHRQPHVVGGPDQLVFVQEHYNKIDPTPQQDRLDGWLKKYDATLVDQRKRAWADFNQGTEVSLVGAAHHMREVLTRFLEKYAKPKDVRGAKWFDETEHFTEENEVKRWAQIQWFVLGDTNIRDTSHEFSTIKRLAHDITRRHHELSGKAHWGSADKERVRYLLRDYETLLEKMFNLKHGLH